MQGQTATQVIDALSNKLQVPATVLWQTLVLQGRIELVKASIYLAILIAGGVVLNRWRAWIIKEGPDDIAWLPFVMVGIVWGGFTAWSLTYFADAVGWLFNPNYFAIDQIFSALHGK